MTQEEGEPEPESTSDAGSEEKRYRATLNHADGTVEDIPPEQIQGDIEKFLDSWQRSPEIPQETTGSGWQGPDHKHPADAGVAAYRVVHKTLKMIPYPTINFVWPNLKVTIQNGDVNRGGMAATTAIAGRSSRHHVIPEYGRVVERQPLQDVSYLSCPNMNLVLGGWEETLRAVSYVEIIVHLENVEDDDYADMIVKGRRAVAALKTLLDLKLGPRLLAMPITEEVGQTFDDWHWNRWLNTGLVSVESQARPRVLEATAVANEVVPLINQYQDLPRDERRRITLASQWYWRADAETDRTVCFVSWWLVVESLEMIKTTDVRPVRERLAILFGTDEKVWRSLVGRLYGLRSEVFHGEEWEVPAERLKQVEQLARVFLAARLLGNVPDEVRDELLHVSGIRLDGR